MPTIFSSIHPQGLLSFAPDSKAIALMPINLVIGANGSGKSNLIDVFGLLRATPTNFAAAVREGGGADAWLWKGDGELEHASLEAVTSVGFSRESLTHTLKLLRSEEGFQVASEGIGAYYQFDGESAQLVEWGEAETGESYSKRTLQPPTLKLDRSILSQVRDPDRYSQLLVLAEEYDSTRLYREWCIGRQAIVRQAQPVGIEDAWLRSDSANLGLILQEIQNTRNWPDFLSAARVFLGRLADIEVETRAGLVAFRIREKGLSTPIHASRLSDGTIRFLTLLAILFDPSQRSLVCIEEPELGLHPDAIRLIGELMIDASERMQLLVTTQSDVLVSAFSSQPESVLVCENTGFGSEFERLDRTGLEHWLKDYALGDVWRMGALGGNP